MTLVSCQASNNGQSGVSFAGSLRCKKTYVAMAMRVFCALISHKIYDHLTRHFRLGTTLGLAALQLLLPVTRPYPARVTGYVSRFRQKTNLYVITSTQLLWQTGPGLQNRS